MAKQVKHECSRRDGLPSTAKPRFTDGMGSSLFGVGYVAR